MAHQQHRQACLARWPGHHSMNTEIRGREGTHRWAHRGARQRAMAATRRHSHSCGREATIQRLWWQGGGIVLTAERPSTAPGGDVEVAGCRPTDEATKSHRKHREARAEALAGPAGADQAARARSTRRSSAAMATIGGEVDESPPSEGSTRWGGADVP
jgi:hypothetical protein